MTGPRSCASRSRRRVLVLAQAALGGLTVEQGLHEYLVAAHLGLAMILLGVVIALWRLARPEQPAVDAPPLLRRLTLISLGLVLATIVAGGLVAGTEGEGTPSEPVLGAHLACGEQFPGCIGEFMPFGTDRLVDIQLTHRLLMYLTALSVLVTVAVAVRRRVAVRTYGALDGAARRSDPARGAQRLARQAAGADRRPPDAGDDDLRSRRLDRGLAAPGGRAGPEAASRPSEPEAVTA